MRRSQPQVDEEGDIACAFVVRLRWCGASSLCTVLLLTLHHRDKA